MDLWVVISCHISKKGWRFIAGSSDCSTAKLSKILSDVLLRAMRTLRNKDEDHIRRTGIRRFFVVERYEEVSMFLNRWRRTGSTRSIRSGDFATMYTTIPHDILIKAIKLCLDEAFAWAGDERGIDDASLRIEWAMEDGKPITRWVRSAGDSGQLADDYCTFTIKDIMERVTFLVTNTFVVNGGVIRRQIVGLPMGTNCAPVLANLLLYAYESTYIDRVKAIDRVRAGLFHILFRYIDDTLSCDNPHWQRAMENKEIYPSQLTLADTTPPVATDPVHFLGWILWGTMTVFGFRCMTNVTTLHSQYDVIHKWRV